MKRLAFGVGFNDNKYPAEIAGKAVKEYLLWRAMLSRCYSEAYLKNKPSYRGCTVCDNFKNYSYFYEWVNKQLSEKTINFHLDKDILFKGNKLYSEETCVFVPKEINGLMTKHQAGRGDFPLGVSYSKEAHKFRATLYKNGKNTFLGYYLSAEEAFDVYKQAKEEHIKVVANRWKDSIDPRVYKALMEYKVEITD